MWPLLAVTVVVGAAFALVSWMRIELQKRQSVERQQSACTACCHCHHHP